MSYPRDLDDYSNHEIYMHLKMRENCRLAGVCYYCKKILRESNCSKVNHSAELAPIVRSVEVTI